MKSKVSKRGDLWQVRAGSGTNFASVVVSTWEEAMNIANISRGDAWTLLDVCYLRALGRQLDKNFTV